MPLPSSILVCFSVTSFYYFFEKGFSVGKGDAGRREEWRMRWRSSIVLLLAGFDGVVVALVVVVLSITICAILLMQSLSHSPRDRVNQPILSQKEKSQLGFLVFDAFLLFAHLKPSPQASLLSMSFHHHGHHYICQNFKYCDLQ